MKIRTAFHRKIEAALCRRDRWWWVLCLSLTAGAGGLLVRSELPVRPDAVSILAAGLVFSGAAYMLFLLISSWFYRDCPETADDPPGCTVIVPAYNEGRHVAATLYSLLRSGYPADRLRIIAVNDGSADDTLYWMERVRRESGNRITVIDLKRNQGKKHALYRGMKLAETEFIVTVDSDSLVAPGALRELLRPFADPRVGAVAGNLRGKRNDRNFFAVMMDVALVYGCEILRTAQSVAGVVFCTPGAFSAYRRRAVLPVLDEWLAQKFLGSPATIGEDRAIATLLLREDWRIVHQRRATAETCLPHDYLKLCRMLLRWNRSDYRENLNMLPMFRGGKKWSARNALIAVHWLFLGLNMLLPLVGIPLAVWMFCGPCGTVRMLAWWFLGAALWSIPPALVYGVRRSFPAVIRAIVFGVFAVPALSYLSVYALFTLGDSRWLTREIRRKKSGGTYSLEAAPHSGRAVLEKFPAWRSPGVGHVRSRAPETRSQHAVIRK